MKSTKIAGWIMMAALSGGAFASLAYAADAPAKAPATAPAPVAPAKAPAPAPQAAPAAAPVAIGPAAPGPGVFSAKKAGAKLHLVVTGHTFTNRDDLEKYLAYRAAEQTMGNQFLWFSFIQHRAKGDKVPVPKGDPAGPRYSFRLEFFQPTWRYKVAGSPAWKSWSPFAGAPFFADGVDPKTITDYEITADIVMHKGMVEDINPLAFDASAVSDYLINQVSAPK